MYKVVSNHQSTPSTSILTLQNEEGGEPFAFTAGQYAAINFFNEGRPTVARCFSIVSSPLEQDRLQFSMRTGGRFTRALSRIQAGDEVNVRGPFGGFVFDIVHDQQALFLAGGIGITPFMSIIRYLTDVEAENKISLVYSCRNQADIPFRDELIKLEKLNPNFKVAFVITEGDVDSLAGQRVAKGRITPELIDNIVKGIYAEHSFYICGPPPFMKGMVNTLQANGVTRGQIVTEAFSQGSLKQTGKVRSWPFNIYVMGAVSIALGSFIVTIFDLLKTLPPASLISKSNVTVLAAPINTRQQDLDQLVNSLASQPSAGAPTDAVVSAQKTATQTTTTTSTNVTVPVQVAPTPVPKVVCRTSPSGTRTCF